ncbi:MAG: DUF2336 domain-containing protein [Rhodospirillales bacterium]
MTVRLDYDRAKAEAAHADESVRLRLAGRADVQPEILYYLAEDPAAAVRRAIAENAASPVHARLLLARDRDDHVRCRVAEKVAQLVPHLDPGASARVGEIVVDILETLARDALPRVRRILSESLKEVANAPESVIQRLAHDPDVDVAAPVLEHSPLLGDDVLIEIINSGAVQGALQAIARRRGLGADVAEAIVARDDEPSIATLLTNRSAQIREETLDRLVDRAADCPSWHGPLAARPQLSPRAARRLCTFVADSLVERLLQRNDLDAETAQAVQASVRTRLAREQAAVDPDGDDGPSGSEAAMARAQAMVAAGDLDEDTVSDAITGGNRIFAMAALAARAEVGYAVVEKIVSTASAKGMIALAWRGGFSPRFAAQLQMRLLRISPTSVLRARNGEDWPLSEDDMRWQLEFVGA